MRVHIVNFYGTRNKGDELMLRGLIGELRKNSINEISVSTYFNKEIDSKLLDNVIVVDSFSKICNNTRGNIILMIAYLLVRVNLSNIAKKILIKQHLSLRQTFYFIENADLILTTGGPFFNENIKEKFGIKYPSLNYITCFIELLYGNSKNIPFSILGQTFSKLHYTVSKLEFSNILSKAKYKAGRESFSVNDMLPSLKSDIKVDIVPDLGFCRSIHGIEINSLSEREKMVCVNVRQMSKQDLKYLFAKVDYDSENLHDKYEEIIAETIAKIVEQNNDYLIVFLPQAVDNDMLISRRIAERANLQPSQYEIINDNIDLQTYINIMGKAKVAITTRYHSMVMAIITKTPFLAIGYSQKVTAALYDYNLRDRVIRGESFNPKHIIDRYNNLLTTNEETLLADKYMELSVLISNYIRICIKET